MKKLALIALAVPALAGTNEPVATVAPAPAAPCCALELGLTGNFATQNLAKRSVGYPKDIDTMGVDLTAVHSFTPKHALTFRVGIDQGDETTRIFTDREKVYLRRISIMPGYRYTHPLSAKTAAFAGVNAGLVNQHIHYKATGIKDDDSAWGLGASGEVGASYKLCPSSEIFAAYQINGNNVNNDFGHGRKSHRQIHHGVRVGVGIKF